MASSNSAKRKAIRQGARCAGTPPTTERRWYLPSARFLNDGVVADFESDTTLAVVRVDGTVLFRKPVKARWHVSELTTTASGSRFCFHEAGYTTFNSLVNFLDIDSGRPFNFETVEVISADSGNRSLNYAGTHAHMLGLLVRPRFLRMAINLG